MLQLTVQEFFWRSNNLNKNLSKETISVGFLIFILIAFLLIYFVNYDKSEEILTQKEINWLSKQNALIYASDKGAPPLRYLEESDGQYKGVLIDYLNLLSVELGVNIELHPMVWENALKNLSEGNSDLCDMFISEKRKNDYLFTKPIYNLRGIVTVGIEHDEIETLNDLKGMEMAIQKGDFASEYLQINYPDIKQVFVNDLGEALLKVSTGEVAATLGDEPVILSFMDKYNLKDNTRIIAEPVYENEVAFAVAKSKPELVPILNKGIDSLSRKNVLEKIQQKWFGISTPIVKNVDIGIAKKYISLASLLVGIIILIMIIWNKSLQRLIKDRTKELEQSKNDLQTVFDGISEYIMVLDCNKNIVNINKSFLDSIDKKKNELLQINYNHALELFHKTTIDDLIEQTLQKQNDVSEERQLGNYIYEVKLYPLLNENKFNKNVLVLLDNITTEKINTSKILQSNKMIAIGQLAAGMAHEIRNPLGIIRNHSFIIKSSEAKNNVIDNSIKCIDSAVIRANNIIENLLKFSAISKNKIENINIYSFLSNIIEIQEKLMKKKDIEYVIDCDKKYRVDINQESLKHIIINLLTNAIDAINQTGTITISSYEDNANIYLEFSDTGDGILEENLEKIFNPFYTTKEPGKGTGLGLYIIYNEVKKLNGNIYVESKLNFGTKFKIVVPKPSKAYL